MGSKIRQYADSGDLTSLKYIFVDALDVDPTFQRYEADYNYCKSVPGLLEQHVELTPFVSDSRQWTEAYWTQLKMDLKKNFSDRRMSHMREVAQVLLADKIRRLTSERQAAAEASRPAPAARPVPPADAPPRPRTSLPSKEEQDRALEEDRRRLAEEKRRFEAEEAEKKRQRAARAAAMARGNPASRGGQPAQGTSSKKAIGIALLAAAAVVVLLLLLISRNPA